MKRIYQFLAILTTGLALAVAPAAADTNGCNIYDTGSDSYNSCTTNVDNDVTISCQNDVYVVNDNSQSSTTGPATVTDNSTSGDAVSGDSTNNNGSVEEIGSSCAPIQTAATTTPVATTETPAAVATTTPTAAKAAPVVASLPDTGSNSAVKTASVAGLSLVALLAIAQVGVNVYRRLALK